MPKKAKIQIVEKIQLLTKEPRPDGVEKLAKYKALYRIIYSIDDEGKIVIIAAVGDRKEIYDLIDPRLT